MSNEFFTLIESSALSDSEALIPDYEEDDFSYNYFMGQWGQQVSQWYLDKNEQAIINTLEIIITTKKMPFNDDIPQIIDLYSTLIGALSSSPSPKKGQYFEALMQNIPLNSPYASNDGGLNYNLACYFAQTKDSRSMYEFIKRAKFVFDREKFFEDSSFREYLDDETFKGVVNSKDHLEWTWWTSIWPIQEWCDSF